MFTVKSRPRGKRGVMASVVVVVGIAVASWSIPAPSRGQEAGGETVGSSFTVPPVESLRRVARPGGLSREEGMQARYILKTEGQPVLGNAYVVVTDHQDEAYLAPLRRLAEHHGGSVIAVDDLGALADKGARDDLARRLAAAKVGDVAVAPRLESFRENMLLGLWSALATLDDDPELDARPGLLVAPDAAGLAALVDRSIAYRPTPRSSLRPFVISQLGDPSPVGTRSLQKLGVMRELFAGLGLETPGLVVRQFPGDRPSLEGKDIWVARSAGPRRPMAEMPEPAARAFDEASLVVMFGHGVPGVACGMRVDAFDHRAFANKVVLCGSCMSAMPMQSDWKPMQVGPDGARVVAGGKRFLMETVERGAVVTYAHMRENAGFPHMFPVVESMLRGETVGEAYQRLIDGLLTWTRLGPDELVLDRDDWDDQVAVRRRNQLLYVIVGDPALQPLERIDVPTAPSASTRAPGGPTD